MEKLIFVYNAKSDIINSVFDYAHKLISPNTYSCQLCKLTHSNFGEKVEWKDFKEQSDIDMKFLHIDEFEEQFKEKFSYPVLLSIENGVLTQKITSKGFEKIDSSEQLMEVVKDLSKQ